MRALLLFVATLAFGFAGARADLVVVQHVEGGGQAGDQTVRIKGDKVRIDLTPTVSMITDGAAGESVTLMHTGKTYLKVSAEQTKSMMEQVQKLRPGNEPAKLQATGKKEKVGEYNCELFTTTLGSVTITYWIARDYPGYQPLLAQFEKLQSGTVSAMGQGALPSIKDFPGMPMKTETVLGGRKIINTLVSVKAENVDPAIFTIPKGYTEVKSPDLKFMPQ